MRLSGMSGSDLRRLGLGAAAARPAGRPAGGSGARVSGLHGFRIGARG